MGIPIADERVIDFITTWKKAGKTLVEIRKALKDAGWDNDAIDSALKETIEEDEHEKRPRRYVLEATLALVVLIIIIASFKPSMYAIQKQLSDDEFYPQIDETEYSSCTGDTSVNISVQSSIAINETTFTDFCTTSRVLTNESKVEECVDCYLVKYTCTTDSNVVFVNCDCNNGACV